MSQLVWWAVFLVPTLGALAWAVWWTGSADSDDVLHSVTAHRRFVEALSAHRSDNGASPRGRCLTDDPDKPDRTDKADRHCGPEGVGDPDPSGGTGDTAPQGRPG